MSENLLQNPAVREAAEEAFKGVQAAAVQNNPLSPPAVASSRLDLIVEIAKKLSPLIEGMTNNEHWYQSRVTLGALAGVIASTAGLFGWTFAAEDQAKWVENALVLGPMFVAAGGGLFTLYGRWRAKNKPIGK